MYYLYTETAFHHMGDLAFMKSLVNESKESGAKGVKFQVLLDYDSFISKQHSMYESFKVGIFSFEQWVEIFNYTHSLGLDIVFMPICKEAFKLIDAVEFTFKYLDIHSVSFYDQDVLFEIKKSNLPIILGIGGRTLSEIDEKILFFKDQIEILMVGFQAFPSEIGDLKLGKIKWLKEKYSSLEIGYADHSSFDSEYCISSNEWAFILGARVFEKHITTSEGLDRWDFQSAMQKEKFLTLVEKLDFLDNDVLKFSEAEFDLIEGKELVYRNRQKIIVAKKELEKGHVLTDNDLEFLMIDNTEGITDTKLVLGKKLNVKILEGGRIIQEYVG